MSAHQRTYGRKRKETAEDKFDAIFGTGAVKKRITVEIGNTKSNGKSFSSTKTYTSVSSNKKESPKLTSSARLNAPNNGHSPIEHNSKTKYDMLFKKNEKNASDKFDALFGEEIDKLDIKIAASEPVVNISEFNDLFGFGNDDDTKLLPEIQSHDTVHQRNSNMERVSRLSPTKSLNKGVGITGAAMQTVGGKVVLNIHKRIKSPKKTVAILPENTVKTSVANIPNTVDSKNSPTHINTFDFEVAETKKKAEVKQLRHLARPAAKHLQSNMSQNAIPSVNSKLKNEAISLVSIQQSTVKSPAVSPSKRVSFQSKHIKEKSNVKLSIPSKQVTTSKVSYNSRPWMQDSEDSTFNSEQDTQRLSSQPDSSQSPSDLPTPKLTRSVTWPEQVGESIVTSLKCDKSAKDYYTVVKHVKNYQNCLEEGEAQEFKDEIDYLLEGLQSDQPISVRCLSVTNLACKCQQHNFRLYLRAHNVSDKVFSHLQDAKDNEDLALSTAALLFMLSRDRKMEISKATLQLLLRLVDPFDKHDATSSPATAGKNKKEKDKDARKYKFFKSKEKDVKENKETNSEAINKIKEMIDSCGDHLLSGKDVSVKRLSSEALLRFTARRAVEWFREEVRIKGGLDHIISLIKSHVETTESMYKKQQEDDKFEVKHTLCTLERLLKVLENAIVNSPRNAMYLVTHQRAVLLKKLARLMSLCKLWLHQHPHNTPVTDKGDAPPPSGDPHSIIRNAILQVIKLLVNISNDNEWVSTRVGEQEGMLHNIVDCVLTIPNQLQEPQKYELTLLSLSLLVNLVESSAKNRIELMKMAIKVERSFGASGDCGNSIETSVIHLLVKLFIEREAAARDNEVLGEEGVKKAAEAKRATKTKPSSHLSSQPSGDIRTKELDGHWEETADGMEWVPSETPDDVIASSQESHRSNVSSSRNPESALTAEEKTEMKETLDKANEHMEHSIVASYAALVLGCLIRGNKANSIIIRGYLPNEDGFTPMANMLKKFLSFMSLTAGMSGKGEKTLTEIIEVIEEESHKKV